jgi:peptidoglycan hydrolase-like protein with peptidoglycan-binding domain
MALRDLVQGMRGEDVRAVQQGLNEYFRGRRPPLNSDGVFGPNTLAAVEAFQLANPGTGKPDGTPDYIVGRRTRRKLFPHD